jgi:outer membrane protein insertion porin family
MPINVLRKTILASLICALIGISSRTHAASPHLLRFSGVSVTQGRALQAKFPFVFEREVTLPEVDEVVRYLMKTGLYSNVEVVSRQLADGPELLLVATTLRKIKTIVITGNRNLLAREVRQILQVEEGKTFERKELIESVRVLQSEYRKRGYRGMNAEVEFETPNDTEVILKIAIEEGAPTVVDRVQVESANPEVVRRIERITRGLKNKSLSEDDLQAAVREISDDLRNNRFLTARVLDPQAIFDEEQSRVRLVFNIENAWRYEFRFEGNSIYTDSALIRNMNLDQLLGTVTTPVPELAERMRRFYQANGFAHVQIETSEKTTESAFTKEITFKIDEGPRVRIKKIEITGNISRQASYYAHFISSSTSDVIGEGYYNRKDVEEGIHRIEEELQNQGYLRAKVKAWRAEFAQPADLVAIASQAPKALSKRGSQATLVLNIDEGPLTVIRQIRFDGVESFSKIQLQNILPIRTSESLRIKDLNAAIEALKNFYYSQGFVEMKILNEQEGLVAYNETSTQATIEFQIFEGPKVVVKSILLEGNTFTKDYVILREMGMKTGDVYTPDLREDSLFHLQKLGLFSRVSIKTLEEGTSIADRTVIVEVDESPPGTFESGVGIGLAYDSNSAYESNLVFRGFVGIAYRNLYGTGRAVSARFDPNYVTDPRVNYLEQKIALSYLEPYILRDRNKGRVNLVRDLRWLGYDSLNGRTVIQEKTELGLLIERDLTKELKLTYTALSFSNFTQYYRDDKTAIVLAQNIGKTGPLIEYDSRDNVFYPTKGIYASFGAEYADPYLGSSEDRAQSIRFAKITGSVSAPIRLTSGPKYIFATSLRGGYVANLSELSQGGVPAQEAFFLGGRSTLRGFQPSGNAIDLERVPNLVQLQKANLRDFYVTSDSYYALIKAELRFPVYGDIQGALFYDGGAVLLSQIELQDAYRDSFGVALRYKFAGGIVAGVEYGKKLNRKNWPGHGYESPEAYHISIGTF